MRRGNATTLQDVAREAGVTAMTVSVVLNGSRSATRVSDATRARILEAAARLRYRPNGVARGLSRRRMDTLGVATDIDGGEINLYFLEVLNGILEASARHGQNTTVFSVKDWQADEQKILEFCDGRVDGMIFIAPFMTEAFAHTLLSHAPFVTIHWAAPAPGFHNLDIENEGAAYALVRHLIGLGHRRIGHFPGAVGVVGVQQRLTGYRRALAEAGLPYEEALVLSGSFNIRTGQERMAALLDGPRPWPTAVFCGSDAIAYGAMEVLAARGVRVPEDMSIVGFDDLLLARMTSPQLTTVRQPFREMGHRAVERLLGQIRPAGPEPDEPVTEIFGAELIVRPSVGSPPA